MGKSSGGSLKSKDVQNLIDLQTQANRINQVSPTGSLTYRGNTATTSLSPQEQAILEQNQVARLLAGQEAGAQFGDIAGGRNAVEKASFDRAVSLLNPQFTRSEEQLRQRLANQGLPQSSNAFNAELGRFSDARNRSLEQAALASVLAGGQEETNQLNQIVSLLGLGQPAQPQFINVPQVNVPYQPPQQGASPLPGLLGLGGLGLGLGLSGGNPAAGQLGFTAGSQAPSLFGF